MQATKLSGKGAERNANHNSGSLDRRQKRNTERIIGNKTELNRLHRTDRIIPHDRKVHGMKREQNGTHSRTKNRTQRKLTALKVDLGEQGPGIGSRQFNPHKPRHLTM